MFNIMEFAANIIRNNPNVPKTPWAQDAINAIMTGDAVKGEELANNLCKAHGMTREQAVSNAKKQMNIPF